MIFSLYTAPLLVVLVTYFGSELEKLSKLKPSKSSKMCHYQYWKRVIVLVNFQDKLIQCKLLVYILSIMT